MADPPGDNLAVNLPGSLQEQGFGDDISVDTPWTGLVVDRSFYTDDRYAPYRRAGVVSVPFWLQPRRYYRGAAWFHRDVDIPVAWDGRSVVLTLERVHWESTVWIGGRRVGSQNSLTTAHRHVLGQLAAGRHRVSLRVDNRTIVDVGPNAHSICDHTQGNWNGVIGAVTLRAEPEVRIARVTAIPDVEHRRVRAKVDLAAGSAGIGRGSVTVRARLVNVPDHSSSEVTAQVDVASDQERDLAERGMIAGGGHVDVDLSLGAAAHTWDEFHPALYELTTTLATTVNETVPTDTHTTTFGLREVGVDGTQITVNGRRTFLRGTLESCVFPLTGYPPTGIGPWRNIIATCQAHGLNLLRFHSWCPPEAAFAAADEAGFYFQVEGPVWANQGAALGESRPVDDYLYEETRKIIQTFGNHPSFLLMAHGNEPAGRDAEFLAAWVTHMQRLDRRHLYTAGAGWPVISENDFDNIPDPRVQRWGEGLQSRINGQPPETGYDYRDWVEASPRPIISHEIGQWCAYPNLAETSKYTGLMQARNFGIFADFLADAGMADRAEEFLHASGQLQKLCYKEEIEAALRTPGFGGFQLLGLSDFPGQGTATVGLLDAFWEEKGYCSAAEFARFCGPTVVLVRLPKRTWRSLETLTFTVQIAHFGSGPETMAVTWSLRDDHDRPVSSGDLGDVPVAVGNSDLHGEVSVSLDFADKAQRPTLVVTATTAAGDRYENDWHLWVYPAPSSPVPTVATTRRVAEALDRTAAGDTVLLFPALGAPHTDVQLGFSTVFWNTAWTKNQAPHTLGITHDPAHPALAGFPSEGWTDWQWWEILHGAHAMILDPLPQVEPIIQPIDTWFTARRLAVLWEARIGPGRIAVCSLDFETDLDDRPAAQQFLHSLLAYLADDSVRPQVQLEPAQLRALLAADDDHASA